MIRPKLRAKPVDFKQYVGQEIELKDNIWHSSGHKIKAIVPSRLDDRSSGVMQRAFCRGEFMILSDERHVKTTENFWLESGVAMFTGSHEFFTEYDLSQSIVDRIVGKIQCNGPWIIGLAIDRYRSIELDSELGQSLIKPCIEMFGSLDALAEVSAIKNAKGNISAGSVGWGHRSMD